MTEQQKQAVEEAAKAYVKPFRHQLHLGEEDAVIADFSAGAKEVINNPEKYGLQPINERQEG